MLEQPAEGELARGGPLPGLLLAEAPDGEPQEVPLGGVLAPYEEVARSTDDLVRTLPDLDASHPLPEAPWFEQGATRSARRVFLRIVAETAQHAGHADILRESLDGQKTMG